MGHNHKYQFDFKKKNQVKSSSPESRTPNSVRIRQSGRTGNQGVTCTITLRRVGCGCMVWSFTTLSECGLGLSLGLRPMKTHSSNQEMKSN